MQAAFLAVLRQWLTVADSAPGTLMPAIDEALRPLCSLLQHWLDESPAGSTEIVRKPYSQ